MMRSFEGEKFGNCNFHIYNATFHSSKIFISIFHIETFTVKNYIIISKKQGSYRALIMISLMHNFILYTRFVNICTNHW